MMRGLVKVFPPQWRHRFGEEFLDQFDSDPRRMTKWLDLARTATGLWWDILRASGDALALGLCAALVLTVSCDIVLGVGMDERFNLDLLSHWWGGPIAALSRRQRSHDGRRRGGAARQPAAASFGLAGVGAGLGLLRTVAVLRAVLRNPNLTLVYSIKNDR